MYESNDILLYIAFGLLTLLWVMYINRRLSDKKEIKELREKANQIDKELDRLILLESRKANDYE